MLTEDNLNTSDEINISLGRNHKIGSEVTVNAPGGYTAIATLRDEAGNIKQVETYHNTVTTAGKAGIADQVLASPTLGKPTHMAVGTGTPSGTALGTELVRAALTSKTRSTNVVTMQGDYAAGTGTGAITEAGIFDAVSTGNMWVSASFSVINKGASDTLSIVWTLTIS